MSWSKEEFMEKCAVVNDDGSIEFNITVDFNDLSCNTEGIGFVNECVSEHVEDGFLLTDLSYQAMSVHGRDVVIRVTADATDFIERFKDEKKMYSAEVNMTRTSSRCVTRTFYGKDREEIERKAEEFSNNHDFRENSECGIEYEIDVELLNRCDDNEG